MVVIGFPTALQSSMTAICMPCMLNSAPLLKIIIIHYHAQLDLVMHIQPYAGNDHAAVLSSLYV